MKNILLILGVMFLFSCGDQEAPKEKIGQSKLLVTSVNYPLHYFAEQIGGDLIRIEYPIPADVDPAYWVPDENALEVYQSADIILANGADYTKWMNNVSLPSSRIVNTSKEFKKSYIELKDVATHSHGPEGKHEHAGYAFTTWLDFELAAGQALTIKEILIDKLPDNKTLIEANYKLLKKDIEALHESMIRVGKEFDGLNILGSHPVYQYLAAAYGLKIYSVHFEPGEMPSGDQWKEYDHLIDHYPSSIMLWEGEPLPEVSETLKEKGIQVVVFNPCGNQPESGDFISTMKTNILNLSGRVQ